MKVEIPNHLLVKVSGMISRGIKEAEINEEGILVFTLTDGTKIELGSVKGDQGPRGESGVYVGTGEMPEGCNVQIDPSGEAFEFIQPPKTASIGQALLVKSVDETGKPTEWETGEVTGGTGGTSDHQKLSNRDAADQHPIEAITGLEAALEGKQPTGSYLTDKDLDTTITMEGKAADAKAVGDALRSLSEEIVELDTTLTQSGKAADAKAVGDALAGKVDGIGITAIMAITQEDYDELVMLGEVSATTLYIITANAGGGDAEVTMVPYLVSDGVAYIDTGYKCTAEDVLELTYRDIGKPDDGTYIKAATPYCGGNAFLIGYAGSRYVQATHAGAYLGYKLTDPNAKATIKRDPTTLYYNGELVGTATAGTKAETMSTLIFAQKLSATSVSKCAHKVYFYGLKIWQGDSLVHYYKPAQDESGVACVYDAVTKEYFYNADTESALTYGEEVEGS